MKKIPVSQGVPAPSDNPKWVPIFPWLTMQPGDSFLVADRVAAASARGSFYRYQRIKKIPKDWRCVQRVEEKGIRLWLLAD